MKEVMVVSDDDAPLARKRKSSTSDAADGGQKKKTEGGASKNTTAALEAEKRKVTGITFAKAPPLVKASHFSTLSIYMSCSCTYVFCTFQEESHGQPQEDLRNIGGFSKYQGYAAS